MVLRDQRAHLWVCPNPRLIAVVEPVARPLLVPGHELAIANDVPQCEPWHAELVGQLTTVEGFAWHAQILTPRERALGRGGE